MAWHIFNKDVRLLWRLAVGVSLVHFVAVAGMFRLGHFDYDPLFGAPLLQLFHLLAFLSTGFLIIAVVHQDAIPGVRQDWLVRPIHRRDLLLAKFLFVLVLAQSPIFLADLTEALASGFPLSQSLAAAASRSMYLLFSFSLPILIFATLTRNVTEVVIGGLLAFAGYVGFQVLWHALSGDMNFVIGVGNTAAGITWITESLQLLLFALGAIVILRLQYWRRKTGVARWLAVGVAVFCLLTQRLPWQSAFAMERSLSQNPIAAKDISVAFDPDLGKFRRPSGLSLEATGERLALRAAGMRSLSLPLHLSGLPADTVLKSDRSDAHLIGLDGNASSISKSTDFEIRNEGSGNSEAHVWQGLYVPSSTYNRIKDQPIRLEIDYSLTLLTLSTSHAISALNGDQRMVGVGWCKTKMNDAESDIRLMCLQAGKAPSCATAFLEYMPSGQRNPEVSSCAADYAPFFRGSLINDALSRFRTNLPFRDPNGLVHYQVDAPKLAESRIVVRTYGAVDHFTRRLVIPAIRLRDWQIE